MKSNTKKVQPVGKEGAIKHIVYDLSLPLEERRKKAVIYESLSSAAKSLGVSDSTLFNSRKVGKRVKTKKGEFAIRILSGN